MEFNLAVEAELLERAAQDLEHYRLLSLVHLRQFKNSFLNRRLNVTFRADSFQQKLDQLLADVIAGLLELRLFPLPDQSSLVHQEGLKWSFREHLSQCAHRLTFISVQLSGFGKGFKRDFVFEEALDQEYYGVLLVAFGHLVKFDQDADSIRGGDLL